MSEKVTEEMLDEYAAILAARLDAILASLPKHHRDHFASPNTLPDPTKKPILAKDHPEVLDDPK